MSVGLARPSQSRSARSSASVFIESAPTISPFSGGRVSDVARGASVGEVRGCPTTMLVAPGELCAKGEGAEGHGVGMRQHRFERNGAAALSARLILTKLSYLGVL